MGMSDRELKLRFMRWIMWHRTQSFMSTETVHQIDEEGRCILTAIENKLLEEADN